MFIHILSAGVLLVLLLISSSYSYSYPSSPLQVTAIATTPQTKITDTKSFWTIGAAMPTPRTEIAGASFGDGVYIIGGFDKSGRVRDIVEVYNIKNNTWTEAAPLPIPLHHTSVSSYNGKLYVAGGYTDNNWNPTNNLFIYDPLKNKWQEGKQMPTARGALTANFINGVLFAVGGQSSSFSSSSSGILATTEAYYPESDSWASKAPMPTARHHAGSAVVDGKLYVIGGRVAGISPIVNVNINEMYDPQQNTWISFEQMPSKRSGIAAAAVSSANGNDIYVFGGEEPSQTLNNNEKYNIKSNKWSSEPPMPTTRHGLAAVSVVDDEDNKIYVIGGGPQPGLSVTNVNEIFHVR